VCIDDLQVAGGSWLGRHHRRNGGSNQDAFHYQRGCESLVGLIADGCGSGRFSEVGARLGARMFAAALTRRLDAGADVEDPNLWRRVSADVVANLRMVANSMGGSLHRVVSNYFLFTIVGFAITPEKTAVFALGDGLVAINGDVMLLGPFPNDQPPYLGYALVNGDADADIELVAVRSTCEIESLLIGTDGALDLAATALESLPGREDEVVGPLSQFWTDDRFFENRDALRRRLSLIGRETTQPDWELSRLDRHPGHLPDDTTLLVVRRGAAR